MADDGTVDARLVALEARIAQQEATIDELNAIVTRQWKDIDALKGAIATLVDRVREINRPDAGTTEPPPPHY